MPFLDPLRVELIRDGEGMANALWRVSADFRYFSERRGLTFTIPAGFETDFASVPRIPIAYTLDGGIAESCATLHDFLYATGVVPRDVADHILEEAMKEKGFGWLRRWTIFAGVRLFGASHFDPQPIRVEIKPAQGWRKTWPSRVPFPPPELAQALDDAERQAETDATRRG